ncbi:MAG: sulfatase-like hydrolase/transferase [Patescibacteria group bacterium]|nr:sulfatase-like hydrolase/transferase [Patescibacteria group bacterium]
MSRIKNINRNDLKYIIFFLLLLLILLVGVQFHFKFEKSIFSDFVGQFFTGKDVVYSQYQKDYSAIIQRYMNFDLDNFIRDENHSLPDIYFIHLESVNSDLINQSIIPNFEKYSSKNGIIFNNFFSNSVQTLKSQESILCALPPSMDARFRIGLDEKKLICIPKILDKYGYKTLFFKSHNLEFSKTGQFMSNIGFQETHNADIMENEDMQYDWGFREDFFYKRVYGYLQEYGNNRKFVYIAVSTTNHYPFIVYDKSFDLPIKNTRSITDKMKNTIYIQDQYLKIILEELKNDKKDKYIFIFSDHSWPLGYHYGNIINESNAYMENFHIPFAFLYFGNEANYFDLKNRVSDSYSELDFLKTVLDLLSIKTGNEYLGNSFYQNLLNNKKESDIENCSISVQPYSDKYITFFYNNKHYIYNIRRKEAYYFDILSDKYEKNKKNITQFEFLDIYNNCKGIVGY